MPLMLERENRMLVANAGNGCGAASPTIARALSDAVDGGARVARDTTDMPPDAPATCHLPYPD